MTYTTSHHSNRRTNSRQPSRAFQPVTPLLIDLDPADYPHRITSAQLRELQDGAADFAAWN